MAYGVVRAMIDEANIEWLRSVIGLDEHLYPLEIGEAVVSAELLDGSGRLTVYPLQHLAYLTLDGVTYEGQFDPYMERFATVDGREIDLRMVLPITDW